MRVDFLLMTPDAGTGVESSTFSQAEMAAEKNEVDVIGVYRTASHLHSAAPMGARVRYLLDDRRDKGVSARSRLIPSEWDDALSAESDRVLVSYLRGTRADIVVTSTPALAAIAAEFVPEKVRVIHIEHCGSMNRGASLNPLLSHGARLDLLVSQTEPNARWLQTRLGDGAPPMQVMPRALRAGFRPKSSLGNRTIVAGGRLSQTKRFTQLIKAFETANELVPGWRLRIYGDGTLRADLRYAVWRSNLAGRIDIIPATSRIAAELSKASIFASTSNSGGVPMLGLEAAAAGVPMVAYDAPTGPAETLRSTGGGLLVPDGEPTSFGVALAHLMDDPEELTRYANLARIGAPSNAPELLASRWEAIYRDVLRGTPPELPVVGATTEPEDLENGALDMSSGGVWLTVPPARGRTEPTDRDVAAEHLRRLFQDRGLPHINIGTSANAPVLGLDEATRSEVIECLETVISELGLVCVAQRGDAVLHVEPWRSEVERPATVDFATVFRIASAEADLANHDSVVDVELWRSDGDGDGTRYAPRRNELAEWVDTATWQRWISSGASTPTGARAWNQVGFPVDAVFTWVDGADPEWDARRRARLAADAAATALDEDHDSVSAARFVSRDEIYYSVSCVRAFMPWIRAIYIVTDGQVHARVAAEFPDVKFVSHRDIFPDPEVLPVFNSRAIESCIHRIPGLSEHFIYFNDDVMVVKPVAVDSFFQANGVARFFPSGLNVNHGANSDAPHLQAGSNNRELLREEFGFEITNTMLHTPHPHVRSVLVELEQRYPGEFAVTRSSGFRSPHDLSSLSSLAQYYGWATGRYSVGSLNYRFLRLNGTLLRYRMMSILEDPDVEIVALGEARPEDPVHQDERGVVKEFLEALVAPRD